MSYRVNYLFVIIITITSHSLAGQSCEFIEDGFQKKNVQSKFRELSECLLNLDTGFINDDTKYIYNLYNYCTSYQNKNFKKAEEHIQLASELAKTPRDTFNVLINKSKLYKWTNRLEMAVVLGLEALDCGQRISPEYKFNALVNLIELNDVLPDTALITEYVEEAEEVADRDDEIKDSGDYGVLLYTQAKILFFNDKLNSCTELLREALFYLNKHNYRSKTKDNNILLSILFAVVPDAMDKDPGKKYYFCSQAFDKYIKSEFGNKILVLDIYLDLNEAGEDLSDLIEQFEKDIQNPPQVPRTKTKVVVGGG